MKFIQCQDDCGRNFYINIEQVCKIDDENNYVYFVDNRILPLPDKEMGKLISAINTETAINDSTIEKLRKACQIVYKDLEVFEQNSDVHNGIWTDGYLTGFCKAMKIIGIDTSEWGK